MDEYASKQESVLETFLFMFKTSRFCGKQCETLKIDKLMDSSDLECLRICTANFFKSTEVHRKFLIEAAESDMKFD